MTCGSVGEYGTHIVGGGTRFLQAGSSLALECVVTHTRAPPSAVLWYRDNNLLDYDSPRGGISLQVCCGEQWWWWGWEWLKLYRMTAGHDSNVRFS